MSDNSFVPEFSKGFYKRLTSGELGLAKTYWVYGVGVGILLNLALLATEAAEYMWGVVIICALSLIYFFIIAVSVFRAAEKYKGPKIWKILAELAVALGVLQIISSFLGAM